MEKPVNTLIFRIISIILKIRDVFYPPKYILKDVEIKPGASVLDFGCGPGSYSIATAEILAGTGKVFALDRHPVAIKKVNQTAQKKKLTNIRTILSDCDTGLESDSVDVVLLYYIFNDLDQPEKVLAELYRVLKPQGILSFSEYNVKKISTRLEQKELFKIKKRDEITHTFLKMPLVVN
jgi:ubiquinone/menaquinone biosynthesis C-methylase UbiE